MWFLRMYVPLAVAITGMCALVYFAGQQTFRANLNDPQIQMAEDGAAILKAGGVPAELVQRGVAKIDAANSLAPWIAVYDEQKTPLESSAVLNGKPPAPPPGVLDAAKNGLALIEGHHLTIGTPANENHVTWENASGTRIALVVVWEPTTKRFVVSGRNMWEIEGRIIDLGYKVLFAWIVIMVATLVATYFGATMSRALSRQ